MKYARAIKKLREELNLTRAQFAKALKINITNIYFYENGTSIPLYKTAKKMVALAEKKKIVVDIKKLAKRGFPE